MSWARCRTIRFLGNSIWSNAELGIDLEAADGDEGVTPNHIGAALGPNGFQNYPVLSSVQTTGSDTTFTGSLNSIADTTYRIELFSNPTSDPSGYGQGETYLGAVSVTTNILGNANFTAVLPVTITAGEAISATATVDLGGGSYGGTSEFAQDLVAVANQPPSNNVPAAQTVLENGSLVFSSANGNQISVSDSDSDGNPEQVSLSVLNGALTLNGTTGLTFSSGTGTNNASMQFTGTITAINNALNGLTYSPAANFSGTDGLGITINDLGNSGVGGPLSASSGVAITVNHVDIAPVNTVPGAQSVDDNATLAFSSANGNPISVLDSDSGGNPEQIALSVGSGTLTLSETGGLTFVAGANSSTAMTVQGTLANINTCAEWPDLHAAIEPDQQHECNAERGVERSGEYRRWRSACGQ